MGTVHKSYRLDAELVERMAAYAEAEGLRQGEAVSRLISLGLDAAEQAAEAARDGAAAVSDDDRATTPAEGGEAVAALISQLEKKDEQIATLMRLNDQGQQLQAAQAQQLKALLPAEGGEIVTTRRTWRQRLGAWIAGEGR